MWGVKVQSMGITQAQQWFAFVMEQPIGLLIILGLICIGCVFLFLYRQRRGVSGKSHSSRNAASSAERPASMPEAPLRHRGDGNAQILFQPSGETDLLFSDAKGDKVDHDETMLMDRKHGLRFLWEVDGKAHREERYDFPLIIGRDHSCQIVIDLPSVSRRHAQLIAEDHAYRIVDMGSRNGIYLDGIRVTDTAHIRDGCEVRMGHVRMTIDFISENLG